ncbi:MAG: hypothetical protein B6245_13055 [Desulfobacteraceae bacterium 4572_88]|nr:MAG: hypothetical protein B6245_13055 [Desulfobacteraceae bacterium 4572_88]
MNGHNRNEGKRCRQILASAKELILTFDMAGNITYLNESGMEKIGYFEEEFPDMNIADIFSPDQLEKIKTNVLMPRDTEDQTPCFHEIEFTDRNLSSLPMEISASPVFKNGSFSEILLIARPLVRERTKFQRGTPPPPRNNESPYQGITQAFTDMILTFDMEGNISYVNDRGADLTGYFKDMLTDMKVTAILPPGLVRMLKRKMLAPPLTEKRKVVIPEVQLAGRNAKLIPVEIVASLIMKQGQPSDILVVIRDLTRRKKLEKELLRAQKFESLDTLSSGLVDNLNNLLTGIMGNIDLARISLSSDDKSHQILSYAKEGCTNVKDLIRQFVTFSKGETPVRAANSVVTLIRDAVSQISGSDNIRYEISLPDDLWLALFDEEQMKRVMNNLIRNAIEAMPSGGQIRIHAENIIIGENRKYSDLPMKDGNYVKISVLDQGIGIPEENLGKIFDPYFSSKKMGKRGRGLGLTIVYSIIKKHHGYVYVDSDPMAQTVFHIYLPVAKKKRELPGKTETPTSLSKGNILIMDDEAIVIEVASQMLDRLGYDATLAKDGMEVIDIYEKAVRSGKAFDAVILDLHIDGGMGGTVAMKKLLQMDPDVKGIVSSGYANDPEMTDFEKYGFCGVVEKPYSMHELRNILNRIIDQNKTIRISKQEWLERRSAMG